MKKKHPQKKSRHVPARAAARKGRVPHRTVKVKGGVKYEVSQLVAQGGMGVIYKAHDLKCERTVAMKVMLKDDKAIREQLDRFVGEARITSRLEHPNIVPVHELGNDEDGNLFYTMKFVRGATLTDIIKDLREGHRRTLDEYPLGRLLTIFQKTCDAVAFAHSRGIVHRDLKPSNIMIGPYGEVLVLDWGLAKPMEGGAPAAPRPGGPEDATEIDTMMIDTKETGLKTISGRAVGTPGFMSPEQLRGDGKGVDGRADVYALGAVLYSILTLYPPVRGKDVDELIRKIVAGDITPPSAFNATGKSPHCPGGVIPQVLSDVAMKAMATSPLARYPSVMELQREIEAYQNGEIWHLILEEDFADPDVLSRWDVMGKHEIRPGELRLYGGEPQLLLLKQEVPGDLRIDFECRQEGVYLNELGCVISGVRGGQAWQMANSGYQLKHGANNNSLTVLGRRDRHIWAQPSEPMAPGRVYSVQAERVGPRLRLAVDGKELYRVVDPNPLTGMNRTLAGLIGWVADMRISRIRVYSLGTPWKVDILDAAEKQLERGHYATATHLFEESLNSFPDAGRLERARNGLTIARSRSEAVASLPAWKEHLQTAWPGANIDIRVDSEGLTVEIWNSGITDLAPLKGLPLAVLHCSGNRIESLDPLRGMRLTTLKCEGNPIGSLEPLRGMPLTTLLCDHCRLSSLEPLRGMPLTTLSCSMNDLKTGLEPLRGLPLTWLNCSRCGLTDLAPLRGLPLTVLYCDGNVIANLASLKGMPLNTFTCSCNLIENLEPLRGSRLNVLHAGCNRIEDLEPLASAPLNMLSFHCNRVTSLEPLKAMSFNALTCGGNPLSSIGSFIKNPPPGFQFDCDTISTEELEWIRKTWSRDFRLAGHARDVEILLAIRKTDVARLKSLAWTFRGHYYLFVPKALTWSEARELCERMRGHLLTIGDRDENEFVASKFPFGSWFWIGLSTADEKQSWVTGEPVSFQGFVNAVHERMSGPKVFCYRNWYAELPENAHNCFMIEWDA